MRDMTEANRADFESFMAERFTDSIDRRRCINGDGNDYMSWDMGVARTVWQHMQQKLNAETNRADQNASYLETLTDRMMDSEKERDALAADREKFAVQCAAAKIAVQYAQAAGFECTLNTPAVDAYLNSVRAEGAEAVAQKLLNMCAVARHSDKETIYALSLKAGEIAAQLRGQ